MRSAASAAASTPPMAASRARWLVTASSTGRGGKAAPALLKWRTLATPGVSNLSNRTSSVMTASSLQVGGRYVALWTRARGRLRPPGVPPEPLIIRSADEIADDPIELVRVLHEHEVIPALVLFEDLDF